MKNRTTGPVGGSIQPKPATEAREPGGAAPSSMIASSVAANQPIDKAMRHFTAIFLTALFWVATALPASGQMLDARRLGMGGVVTSDNSDGRTSNVAFRAVPKGTTSGSIPLPVGLIQYAGDAPTFDPEDPDFNVFEIMDLVANPPMTLTLSAPDPVSSDISIFVAKDSLQIDLADVQRAIPEESMKHGGVYHLFSVGKQIGSFFIQLGPVLHVKNELDLSDQLRAALREAEPFEANTRYGLTDEGTAQAAIAYQAGFALRAAHSPGPREGETSDPRRNGATALYLGAGPKYFMGLAYGQIVSSGGLTTGDTLFGSSDPVSVDMVGRTRHATLGGPGGLGHGYGADVGAVLYWRNYELGVGLTDVASRIHWSTTVNRTTYDDSLNEFVSVEEAEGVGHWSHIPTTTTVSIAKRIGPTTLAANVVNDAIRTRLHMGAESWLGPFALRGGAYRDSNARWQVTAGTGYRFGGIGLDLAVATNSRNVEEARAVELCTSITLY